eukprot:scaffold1311_cov323-Prasinococcus_capsulatus_cf.AAC.4
MTTEQAAPAPAPTEPAAAKPAATEPPAVSKGTKWFPKFVAGLPSMEGKTVVLTGTTTGCGKIASRVLLDKGTVTSPLRRKTPVGGAAAGWWLCRSRRVGSRDAAGARVICLNRKSERATKFLEDCRAAFPDATVDGVDCDLQSFQSVREAASQVKSMLGSEGEPTGSPLAASSAPAAVAFLLHRLAAERAALRRRRQHRRAVQQRRRDGDEGRGHCGRELFPLISNAAAAKGEARIVNHSSIARCDPARSARPPVVVARPTPLAHPSARCRADPRPRSPLRPRAWRKKGASSAATARWRRGRATSRPSSRTVSSRTGCETGTSRERAAARALLYTFGEGRVAFTAGSTRRRLQSRPPWPIPALPRRP